MLGHAGMDGLVRMLCSDPQSAVLLARVIALTSSELQGS